MPDKHPNTVRHGGPGASEENAKQPAPEVHNAARDTPDDDRNSHKGTGGGEPDKHHNHDPKDK